MQPCPCTPRNEKGTPLSSLCHPRRLSPTPVPDLIGDPVKEWIQSREGSRVFPLFFVREENDPGSPIGSGMTEGEKPE